jgi:hypothetical protein
VDAKTPRRIQFWDDTVAPLFEVRGAMPSAQGKKMEILDPDTKKHFARGAGPRSGFGGEE